MKIEHIGLNVADPVALAAWYVRNLGMKVVRQGPPPISAHFLADSSGQVMIEVYHNTAAPVPDYLAMDLLTFHIALAAADVPATYKQLIAGGATPLSEPAATDAGDVMAVVRDPWGVPLQLAKRAKPMI